MKNTNAKNKGFTLVELLVVVAIIGILASVVSANLLGSKTKARDSRRLAELKTLQQAVESYQRDNCQPSFSTHNTVTSLCNFPSTENWKSELSSYYKDGVPNDPQEISYEYKNNTDSTGKSYCVGTTLELPSVRPSPSNCDLGTSPTSNYRIQGP